MITRSPTTLLVAVTFLAITHRTAARPEPPLIGGIGTSSGGGSSSFGPYPPPRPPLDQGGYNYAPPPQLPQQQPPPSIGVNSFGSSSSEYGPPAPAPIIHKHVYVHVPPPDNEIPTTRKPISVPPPQKHYKIVFIKAPVQATPPPPVIPPLPQNEEKTLVYVLVKKQDEPAEIIIPTPAPTPPSKPEVYFIRYKTQKQEGNAGGPYPESASLSLGGPPADQYGPPGDGSNSIQAPSNSYGVPL
ncbi:uncharacterized protein LOC129757232 isoform X2 [Uranotaenia lowii]|uniref:uncharacterized protein LOC129757232 isoform X2 n=1 Tax=Uranotaenia lowii TaxID=190385 RepID=UPI002479502D|nr:uncharacterized protein LOC129757232 isoform X2 [Uranotaenia lowii]